MDRGYLLWRPEDGEATTALRRALTQGLGLLFLALALLCLPGAWLQDDPTARLLSALSGALLLVTAARCAGGAIGELELGLSAVASVLVNVAPDLTGSSSSFTAATLFSIWMITATANLRPRAAYVVLAFATAGFLATAWIVPTQSVGDAFDTAVFTVGMCVAEVGFLRVLTRAKREQDALTEEVTALEIEAAMRALEQASSSSVRRVLHDEVLTALRAIAELPPQRRDEVVRASREAAVAVRQHLAQS